MKKTLFTLVFMSFILLLTGCLSDPIQDDLITYVNEEISPLADLEADVISNYESVTGANYTDDLTLYTMLTESVIPDYGELVQKVEAIKVNTDEVREIHETYIEGANTQYNAFVKLVTALEYQDLTMVEDANVMLDKARKLMRDYQNEIDKLAKEHNVEFEE